MNTTEQEIYCNPLPPCLAEIQESCRQEDLEFIQNLGKTFFPAESWRHLSDDELLRLSEHEMQNHASETSFLGEEVRRMLGKWLSLIAPPDQQHDFKWMDIWIALTAGARISLAEECQRRLSVKK